MPRLKPVTTRQMIAAYYAGTLAFVCLDYLLDVNVRLSFLDQWPGWRALYYVICFVCFAVIWRYPAWTNLVAAAESLINLSALILGMAVRVTIVSDEMIEAGRAAVTPTELVNFLLSGSAAYLALVVRSRAAHRDLTAPVKRK